LCSGLTSSRTTHPHHRPCRHTLGSNMRRSGRPGRTEIQLTSVQQHRSVTHLYPSPGPGCLRRRSKDAWSHQSIDCIDTTRDTRPFASNLLIPLLQKLMAWIKNEALRFNCPFDRTILHTRKRTALWTLVNTARNTEQGRRQPHCVFCFHSCLSPLTIWPVYN